MTHDPLITDPSANISHCQARTPSGRRCRMAISDPQSGFCLRHTICQTKARAQAALAARLIGDTGEFRSAVEINRSLGELYKLLARDEIAPRRAAVMAYTCNLLLRTLPAIEHELHPPSQKDRKDQEDDTIILDIPSAVADRALKARHPQDPERAFYERMARHGSRPAPVDSPASGALGSDILVSPTESPK